MNGLTEEQWLSEEFSAIDRQEIMRKERERIQYLIAINNCEPLPEDPEKCGEYIDCLEALEEQVEIV